MVNKFLALVLLLAILPAFVSAGPGSIKTTTSACNSPVDENHYLIGETVYIHGSNFASSNYAWDITGQPGGASCDPNIAVALGNFNVNSSNDFCFPAYVIQNGDCGEYKVTFDGKHDNYRVDDTPLVPEFGFVVGLATILGALTAFLVIRRN